MLKRFFIPAFVLALLLAACGGKAGFILSPVPPTATRPEQVALNPEPGCSVISPMPTPGPTQRSLFPPVSAQDWVDGPDSAQVIIVEYSDFQ